jgi:hypothetical protein
VSRTDGMKTAPSVAALTWAGDRFEFVSESDEL